MSRAGRSQGRAWNATPDIRVWPDVDMGRYGIWRCASRPRRWRENELIPELAQHVEALGYGSIWIGGSDGVSRVLTGTVR